MGVPPIGKSAFMKFPPTRTEGILLSDRIREEDCGVILPTRIFGVNAIDIVIND